MESHRWEAADVTMRGTGEATPRPLIVMRAVLCGFAF